MGSGFNGMYGMYREVPGGPDPLHNGRKGKMGKDTYGTYREVPGGPDPLHNGRKGYMGSKT